MSPDTMIVLGLAGSVVGMLLLHLWLAARVMHLEWRASAAHDHIERLRRVPQRSSEAGPCRRRRRR